MTDPQPTDFTRDNIAELVGIVAQTSGCGALGRRLNELVKPEDYQLIITAYADQPTGLAAGHFRNCLPTIFPRAKQERPNSANQIIEILFTELSGQAEYRILAPPPYGDPKDALIAIGYGQIRAERLRFVEALLEKIYRNCDPQTGIAFSARECAKTSVKFAVQGYANEDQETLEIIVETLQRPAEEDQAQIERRRYLAEALVEHGEGIPREDIVAIIAKALADEAGCGRMKRALLTIVEPGDYKVIVENYWKAKGGLSMFSDLLFRVVPELKEKAPDQLKLVIAHTLHLMSQGQSCSSRSPFELLDHCGFGQTEAEQDQILEAVRTARRYASENRDQIVLADCYIDYLEIYGTTLSERWYVWIRRLKDWYNESAPTWFPYWHY